MLRYVAPPDTLPVSRTDNPYWDSVRAIPGNNFDWKYDRVWSPDWTSTYESSTFKPLRDRHSLCGEYAWAIPDPDSLDFVAEWLNPQAIEIGAGVGYWAWQLSQLGVDIVAYDAQPPQLVGQNHWHSPRGGEMNELSGETRPVFFDVREGNHLIAAHHPDRTLFLCWPPYSNDMANKTLKAYKGKRFVYIGESAGGCTGDDWFFKRLERSWKEVAEHRPIQWWGVHDVITVYEREEQ